MKKQLSSVIVCLMFMVFLGACSSVVDSVIKSTFEDADEGEAESAEPVSQKQPAKISGKVSEQKVFGTWMNPEYNGKGRSAKLVFSDNADGSINYLAYDNTDGSGEVYKGALTYDEQWVDSEGRLYGRSTVKLDMGMSWNTLDRISADGSTLEVQSGVKEINPKGSRYSIYYRQ